MRLPTTMSSITAASTPETGAAGVCARDGAKPTSSANPTIGPRQASRRPGRPRQAADFTPNVTVMVTFLRLSATSQNGFKCAAQGFVPKHKSAAHSLVRDHALTSQQKLVGEIAGHIVQQRCGNAKYGRPLK